MARGAGCYSIRTDILESVGFEVEAGQEIQMATMADIEEIFAKIHEQYPDMEVYRPVANAFMQYSNVDYLGGNNFGVLMNYGNDLEVVNLI
jgi:putative aldouronate transport system substrate-binding protein